MVAGRSLEEILGLVTMSDFEDYTNLGQVIERNVTTMYDYLYRYREPNSTRKPADQGTAIIEIQRDCPMPASDRK